MTNVNVNEVLAQYSEEDRNYLVKEMRFMAFLGIGNAPTTTEEFIAWCEKNIAFKEETERKEREKAERKANKEKQGAEEMGMTIEEYKEYKKMIANKKRHETEIRKAYKTIEEMKKKIAYEEKKVAYYEEKIKNTIQ